MTHRVRVLIAAILLPTPLVAADPQRVAMPDEHRLSDVEVQKILENAAAKHQSQPVPVPPAETLAPPPRPIEGEMGVAIGTGGYREAFGTAVVPLGQDGVAIISFDTAESNRSHRRRR